MQDNSKDKPKNAKPSPPDAEKLAEQRVDQMMDPELPDPPAAPVPAPQAASPPPLDIFENAQGAPDVPKGLLDKDTIGQAKEMKKVPSEVPKPAEAEILTPVNPDYDDPKTDAAVDEITAQESDEVLAAEDEKQAASQEKPKQFGRLKRWLRSKWLLPTLVILLIIVAGAIPLTRYKVLGLFLKQSFSVTVVDSTTHTPVSSARLTLAGQSAQTNNEGLATLRSPVGQRNLKISKQYYQSYDSKVLVQLSKAKRPSSVQLVAVGRQVPIRAVNKITGQPLVGAQVKVLDTEAKTDSRGQAIIVLPTSAAEQTAKVSLNSYNLLTAKVIVSSRAVSANTFALTPAGKVYFLSNLSGTIDVMKSNLDGSDRQTVLAGTGSEDPKTTELVASSDWKYLALLSRRDDSPSAKLYLINASSGQLSTIDSSGTSYNLIGFHGDDLLYSVDSVSLPRWQSGYQTLKSYDAASGNATALDKSAGSGQASSYAYQSFDNFNLSGDNLIYTVQWRYGAGLPSLAKQKDAIRVAKLSSHTRQDALSLPATSVSYIQSVMPTPNVVYFALSNPGGSTTYYKFKYNVLQPDQTIAQDTFNKTYPSYLLSPSGQQTFWSELRDGKNTLEVGDQNAGGASVIAKLSDFAPYGWFSDKYLLVSRGGSELFIMPATSSGSQPLKISDYYQPPPAASASSYGYGG